MVTRLDAGHIAAQSGGYEPQRKNNFMINLSPPSGGGEQVFQLSILSFPFKRSTTNVLTINYLNEVRKFPGRTTYENGELVLHDYVDQATAQVMDDWRKLVHNPDDGTISLSANLKVDATLELFDPSGGHSRAWEMIGVWPSSDNLGEGSMDDDAANTITYTLAMDLIKRTF